MAVPESAFQPEQLGIYVEALMKFRTNIRFIPVLIFCCFLWSNPAFSQGEKSGEVNWVGGYVTGIGHGTANPSGNPVRDRLMAERAAVVGAQRALLEIIKGVRIDSETIVENMMVKEDVIKSRVEGIVKGARIFSKKYELVDGAPMATVEMRLCLNNAGLDCQSSLTLSSVLNLDQKNPLHVPPRVILSEPLRNGPTISGPTGYDPNKPVTGVIFVLDGRYFERELLPVVIAGKDPKSSFTVYSVKIVNPSIVRTYGIVRYAESIEDAKKISYLGDNVMIVPISEVSKNNFIVIDSSAAKVLHDTLRNDNNYLSQAKVAITSH
jgi:hypothetical protein